MTPNNGYSSTAEFARRLLPVLVIMVAREVVRGLIDGRSGLPDRPAFKR